MADVYAGHTGTLELAGGVLRNRSTWFGDWEMEVSRIRLVGEATDENGPFADDWYIVVAADGGGWLEASMYVPGVHDVLDALGRALGSDVAPPMLFASTTFDSRALWPASVAGRPVFRYDQAPPRNWLERAVYPLIRPSRNIQRFTDEIAGQLAGGPNLRSG